MDIPVKDVAEAIQRIFSLSDDLSQAQLRYVIAAYREKLSQTSESMEDGEVLEMILTAIAANKPGRNKK